MKRTVTIYYILACLGALALGSCSSSETTAPEPPTDPAYLYAGTGRDGNGPMGNTPRKTRLYWPQDIVFTPDGQPMVMDWNNHRVISIDMNGHCVLVAGASQDDFGDPCPPLPDPCQNIVASTARLNHPTHVAFDANENMVLCAWHNSELFLLDMTTGLMDRFCGNGGRNFGPGNDPQTAANALVDLPASVAFDPQGRLCFTDQANFIIRRIDFGTGIVETIAGTQPVFNPPPNPGARWIHQFGYTGDDGPATSAKLHFERGQIADPSGKICFDALGNMYIADTMNHVVRKVTFDANGENGVITRFAGKAPAGSAGVGGYSGDGGPALNAALLEPRDVAVAPDGTVYIADTGNNVIRRVRPNGNISTVVGVKRTRKPPKISETEIVAMDGASARAIKMTEPSGVEVDANGKLWIADTGNSVIWTFKIEP